MKDEIKRKRLLILGLLLSVFIIATAQTSSSTAKRIVGTTTLPATCTAGNNPQVYIDTNATTTAQFYICTSANTWTVQGGGSGTATIASGTAALGTGAITSGTCATVVTAVATGALTTDVITWGFNSDPTSTTGYSATANGMLTIIVYPSSNQFNAKVCNNTSGSITPGAVTLNWRIVR